MADFNCMSYWFPVLKRSGVLVPETRIIRTDCELIRLMDGEDPDGFADLCSQINDAARTVGGYPAFLRTGHGSGKHNWENTCYLHHGKQIPQHVFNLVEWSETVGMTGLPYNVWVVRKMLPLVSHFKCTAYGGFPVSREFRSFVIGGKPRCKHPYWPTKAVLDGEPDSDDWAELMFAMYRLGPEESGLLNGIAERVAAAFKNHGDTNNWSVDVAQCTSGCWWVTDMAIAEQSWHWPECPNSGRLS